MPAPLRILLKAILNIVLVYVLARFLPQYLEVTGGLYAFVIIGALLTLLNLFLRPILSILTFPFRLVATLFTAVLVNAFFLWIVYSIVTRMDPAFVTMLIQGGLTGWIILSIALGLGNWAMKKIV